MAYTVRLTQERLIVSVRDKQLEYSWASLLLACRLRHCICLYVDRQKAYLLPAEEGSSDQSELWELVSSCLPADKLRAFP